MVAQAADELVAVEKLKSKVLWSSWSARRPVKAEVAGSSPVRTAKAQSACTSARQGQVAQLVRASD